MRFRVWGAAAPSYRSGFVQSHSAGSAVGMLFLVLASSKHGALKKMNSRCIAEGGQGRPAKRREFEGKALIRHEVL
jgi:hypothetical protein